MALEYREGDILLNVPYIKVGMVIVGRFDDLEESDFDGFHQELTVSVEWDMVTQTICVTKGSEDYVRSMYAHRDDRFWLRPASGKKTAEMIALYPHACPRCEGPAYVGFLEVDHADAHTSCPAQSR